MSEEIPKEYLPIAKKELEEDQCLCVGGDKNGACDNCEFRKAVVEEIEKQEAEKNETTESQK